MPTCSSSSSHFRRSFLYFYFIFVSWLHHIYPFSCNQSRERRDPFSITLIWLCVFRSCRMRAFVCASARYPCRRKSKMIRLFSASKSSLVFFSFHCLHSDSALMWSQSIVLKIDWKGARRIWTYSLAEHKLRNCAIAVPCARFCTCVYVCMYGNWIHPANGKIIARTGSQRRWLNSVRDDFYDQERTIFSFESFSFSSHLIQRSGFGRGMARGTPHAYVCLSFWRHSAKGWTMRVVRL